MDERKLEKLLNEMTLHEKVMQLVQLPGTTYLKDTLRAGTEIDTKMSEEDCYAVGSILYAYKAEDIQRIQERVMKTQPHGIPALFMMDVIHGFRTIFPIPLAQAGSFDMEMIEECAAAAAEESAAEGLQVHFSPMVDLVRDPRWGRVMESGGEDPLVNSEMGRAMIRGYRIKNTAACLKHFAAYSAPEGGRDYNNVELSKETFKASYLPAYKACVDEGIPMVMSSFNTLNGQPATGNAWMMKQVLREEMGFDGVLITDWNAIDELVSQGVCKNRKEAALLAFRCGVDIDMCSQCYAEHLEELVNEGAIKEEEIDISVRRVLQLKNRMGLFETPLPKGTGDRNVLMTQEKRDLARTAVQRSLVLLKNSDAAGKALLPISGGKKIALVGPFAASDALISSWAPNGEAKDVITIKAAAEELQAGSDGYRFAFAEGTDLPDKERYLELSRESGIEALREGIDLTIGAETEVTDKIAEAVQVAKDADIVIACIGEHPNMSGEGASRVYLDVPHDQIVMLREIYKVNRNIVSVVFAGRPLKMAEVCKYSRSIIYAWLPGIEGGHGIMDVLTGAANPSAKLAMSFPITEGQIPVYYNHFSTGRPKAADQVPDYLSAYLDCPNEPLYPFGYGLSYTTFEHGATATAYNEDTNTITVHTTVRNTGARSGRAISLCYLSREASDTVLPVKELGGFKISELEPGEERAITFEIRGAEHSLRGARVSVE